MTDDEAAEQMIKLLSGEHVTYASYELDGQVREIPVVGGGTVVIPRGARAWYSWHKGVYLGDPPSPRAWAWPMSRGVPLWNGHGKTVNFEYE